MYISPASLILLGDHTHYNDGILISASIDKYWICIIKKRKDSEINLAGDESDVIAKMRLENLNAEDGGKFRLIKGLVQILKEDGLLSGGFDCVLAANVPECVGLGSSASQQVGFLNALRKAFSLKIDDEKLLNIVRRNELNLIGKISNLAHHYTIQYGKENRLSFIDLRTNEHKTISLDSTEYSLVICDSGEKIIEPQKICAERIEECEVGVKGLRLYIWGIKNLRDVELDFLIKHVHMLPGRIFSRVLYNVKERSRAQTGLKFLRKKSIDEFGRLITESHKNLSDDYDLSNEQSDFLVGESLKIDGVIGAKLISCSPSRSTFHVVKNETLDFFKYKMNESFKNYFNRDLKIFTVNLTGGIKKISQKEI